MSPLTMARLEEVQVPGGTRRIVGRPPVQVRCWGTRGSIPSPGPQTARFGGNTSCLEVRFGKRGRIVFDAGTGIRGLGQQLLQHGGPTDADLFLTHWHWDHIQGIPFFAPLYDPRTRIRIHAPAPLGTDIRALLAEQMSAPYFPMVWETLDAQIETMEAGAVSWEVDGATIEAFPVCHGDLTYAYRFQFGGAVVVYAPDNELQRMREQLGPSAYQALVAFCRDADVLIHDAMYTAEEYEQRQGWGHSTYGQAVQLAEEVGAKSLYLFHHAPERSDLELEEILASLRSDLVASESNLHLALAAEGEPILVSAQL